MKDFYIEFINWRLKRFNLKKQKFKHKNLFIKVSVDCDIKLIKIKFIKIKKLENSKLRKLEV